MTISLQLSEDLGTSLADGYKAHEYRMARLDPHTEMCEEIILDFTGVRRANSSFVNALVAAALEQHGPGLLAKLIFKGCNPAVKVLVESAINLGMDQARAQDA